MNTRPRELREAGRAVDVVEVDSIRESVADREPYVESNETPWQTLLPGRILTANINVYGDKHEVLFMLGLLTGTSHHLNLDRAARNYRLVTIPFRHDVPLAPRKLWTMLRVLFLQAIRDGASAIHQFYDVEDNQARLLYGYPSEGDAWYEMVPPPNVILRQEIDLLRSTARIDESRPEGVLEYKFGGKRRFATCVSPHLNDVQIYFSALRPKPLNKAAGDNPATPSVPPYTPEDFPRCPRSLYLQFAPQVLSGEPLIVIAKCKG